MTKPMIKIKRRVRRHYDVGQTESTESDIVFGILGTLAGILVFVILLINPVAKDATVKKVANYVLEMSWNNDIDCDVDLYVQAPDETSVYFRNKNSPLMHIERDDTGIATDSKDSVKLTNENLEVWTLRGYMEGDFLYGMHLYGCKMTTQTNTANGTAPWTTSIKSGTRLQTPLTVNFRLTQLNPSYKIVFDQKIPMSVVWSYKIVGGFTLTKEANETYSFNLIPDVSDKPNFIQKLVHQGIAYDF